MSNVNFYYFNLKGLGEPSRLILAYADVKFTDNRVTKEEWAKLKPTMPFGVLPVLEIDGKKYSQSLAIARYLGHKHGLAGKDLEEDFEIDQNMDFLTDIRTKVAGAQYEADEAAKKKKQETLAKEFYPVALEKLNEIVSKNNGHMALGRLTWADFVFAGTFDWFKMATQMPDMGEKYPSFQKLVDTVYSIPKVKEFSQNTPKSDVNF